MALALKALADDEKTVTGEGKCAKCALKETDSCQNVVQVMEGNKTVTYYLVHNDVSKKFHENICKETKKPAPKMDGARAHHLHLAAGVKRRENPAGRGAWSLVTKPTGGNPGSNRLQCGSWW